MALRRVPGQLVETGASVRQAGGRSVKKKLLVSGGVVVITASAEMNSDNGMVKITDPTAKIRFPLHRSLASLTASQIKGLYDAENPNEMAWLEI